MHDPINRRLGYSNPKYQDNNKCLSTKHVRVFFIPITQDIHRLIPFGSVSSFILFFRLSTHILSPFSPYDVDRNELPNWCPLVPKGAQIKGTQMCTKALKAPKVAQRPQNYYGLPRTRLQYRTSNFLAHFQQMTEKKQ